MAGQDKWDILALRLNSRRSRVITKSINFHRKQLHTCNHIPNLVLLPAIGHCSLWEELPSQYYVLKQDLNWTSILSIIRMEKITDKIAALPRDANFFSLEFFPPKTQIVVTERLVPSCGANMILGIFESANTP